ncbi:MAG TPA: hypothetical protein VKT29_07640 [Terriglobales bacterium]|nr:hypothetical protein [Terriglobales bacterium]
MKTLSMLVLLAAFSLAAAQNSRSNSDRATVESMQRKLDRIQNNGAQAHPQPLTTVMTEQEINAYVASERVQLPKGVQSARFSGQPGVIDGVARVDFDQLTAGSRSMNPLLSMFSGVHDVAMTAHGSASRGTGTVHIDSVALDGVQIPDFALQLFVDHYIKPKHPNLGIDNRFQLPDRIDTAMVGNHELTVTQK